MQKIAHCIKSLIQKTKTPPSFLIKSHFSFPYPLFSTIHPMEPQQNSPPSQKLKRKHSELSSISEDSQKKDSTDKKICLQGVDSFFDEKKLFKQLKAIFPEDIKIEGIIKKKGNSFAFLLFDSIEDKVKFENFINTNKPSIKNKKLNIKPAKDSDYHKFKKIHTLEKEISEATNKIIVPKEQDIQNELAISIQQRVCPLWKTPYPEQVSSKREALLKILGSITKKAKGSLKSGDPTPKWMREEQCCELVDFLSSPNNETNPTFYYRNKAELTIGVNHEGKINVGFNRGNFNKGIMWIEEAGDCPIISKEAIKLSQVLQDYIRSKADKLPAFDKFTHKGFWRNIVIRQSNKTGELLISLVVCDTDLPAPLLEECKNDIKALFLNKELLPEHKLVGLVMLFHNGVSDNIPFNARNEILYGENFYKEEILGKKFIVSPDSFLQVNTPQTERLYSLIGEMAKVDNNTIFLDICSGIGTIGLCLADQAKQIVAIEMVEAACKDAEKNALENQLKNFTCVCGKVEDVIDKAIEPFLGGYKIVGVLDPPRAGLHGSVVKKLRTCKGLDKLVYVSCNPQGMVDNLLELCLPANKKRKGPAFSPIKCFGVDLFPLTEHFECVMVLERLYDV